MKNYGIYVHVPFCKSKCYYCDFSSWAGNESLIEPYFNALKKEILLSKANTLDVSSIFIGGGTPSLVEPQYIEEVINVLNKKFSFTNDIEITIESNPGTLSFDKLKAYKKIGINRLSMGLQAAQDSLLHKIGRIHSFGDFKKNYDDAIKAGFDNINIDLMFALPNQSFEDWQETLQLVTNLKPQHISAYSLKIEEDTPFGCLYEDNKLAVCDDELDRKMYHYAIKTLGENGLKQYEISNFSKEGLECKHNLLYWRAKEYLGFGVAAHSYFEGVRYSNTGLIDTYIEKINNNCNVVDEEFKIDKIEAMSETMILGLRLNEGVSAKSFMENFNEDLFQIYKDQISKLSDEKLIDTYQDEHSDIFIRLTPRGLDFANQVMMEFI